ncbi:MAG: hypothetical protein Q8L23_16700 [Caulobacter sp.]|nr:hypothetical protein [Caulobacter sp.]
MSVRLSLLTLATLALGACDGMLPAPTQQAACCCRQCPADAAPAAKGPAVSAEAGPTVQVAADRDRVVRRVRATPAVRRDSRVWRYETSSEDLSGGRYGGRYGGVSVSVSENESSSERYSYSESSSSYGSSSASGGGYAYGYGSGYRGGPGAGRVSRDPPHHPGYHLAGTDRDGYLTWPGKVED